MRQREFIFCCLNAPGCWPQSLNGLTHGVQYSSGEEAAYNIPAVAETI